MINSKKMDFTQGEWLPDFKEIEANVKLVCAAKYLLAACVEFVRKVECGEARSTKSYKQMKEAINKASVNNS